MGAFVAGVVSSVVCGALLSFLEIETGIAAYSFGIWFVPVGAAASGVVGCSGFYLALLAAHAQPRASGFLYLLVFGSISLLTVYYCEYAYYVPAAARELLSFPEFLHLVTTETELTVSVKRASGDTGALGDLGYLYQASLVVGYAVGGLAGRSLFRNKSRCGSCGRYRTKVISRGRYTDDDVEYQGWVSGLASETTVEGAEAAFGRLVGPRTPDRHAVHGLVAHSHRCKDCGSTELAVHPTEKSDGQWIESPEPVLRLESRPAHA